MLNYLYKLIIDDVTDLSYGNCLEYFPENSKILDVGIGNGIMLEQYHSLIRSKKLKITGIDVNRQYLKHCRKLIRKCNLEDLIRVHDASVESYRPPKNHYYDYILFSMSFMLFDDQQLVLDRIKPWVKPQGEVIFCQTMFEDRSLFLDLVKPRLKYLTTIDFGKVTYKKDFFDLLDKQNMTVTESRVIKKELFKGEYHLIVSSPESGNGKRPRQCA